MEIFAYVRQALYQSYLEKKGLKDTLESFQAFLRDVGTPTLLVNRLEVSEYIKVPSGSCIRLHSPASWEKTIVPYEPQEEVKLRSSSDTTRDTRAVASGTLIVETSENQGTDVKAKSALQPIVSTGCLNRFSCTIV